MYNKRNLITIANITKDHISLKHKKNATKSEFKKINGSQLLWPIKKINLEWVYSQFCEAKIIDSIKSSFSSVYLHLVESIRDIIPEWLHSTYHGEKVEGVSEKVITFSWILVIFLLVKHIITLLFDKISKEKPLLKKICQLDKALFTAT